MGKAFEKLSPEERVAYYRGMAAESLRLAKGTDDCDQKASFVNCAARWLALAHEVENMQVHSTEFRKGIDELRRRTH